MIEARRKFVLYPVILVLLAGIICWFAATDKITLAVAVSMIPLVVLCFMAAIQYSHAAFYLLFVVNYFIPLMMRYMVDSPVGVTMDAMIVFNIFVILIHAMSGKRRNEYGVAPDAMIASLIWLIYCILEVFNPQTIDTHMWFTHIRNMALYCTMIFLIAQVAIRNIDMVKTLIVIWSLLTIVSVIKAMIQKYIGFDAAEKYFLYVLDGQRTHFLHTGIRYFSIFTDASNYGAQMGYAAVVFSICSFYFNNKFSRIYLLLVSALAIYGMLISGTRSALAVPLAGISAFIVLARNLKVSIPTAIVLALAVFFLAGTNIGQGNAVIRRARSAFHREQDRSYQVRKENQAEMKPLMAKLPFGNSLGMSGGRANHLGERVNYVATIPTDSWFVQLWVETGVVGVVIYMLMMAYFFIRCGWLVMFTLKEKNVRGICAALYCGTAGLFVMSSNNEVFNQYPNAVIVYTCIAIIFIAPRLEKEELRRQEEAKTKQIQ